MQELIQGQWGPHCKMCSRYLSQLVPFRCPLCERWGIICPSTNRGRPGPGRWLKELTCLAPLHGSCAQLESNMTEESEASYDAEIYQKQVIVDRTEPIPHVCPSIQTYQHEKRILANPIKTVIATKPLRTREQIREFHAECLLYMPKPYIWIIYWLLLIVGIWTSTWGGSQSKTLHLRTAISLNISYAIVITKPFLPLKFCTRLILLVPQMW